MKAISVRRPFSFALFHGKNVENRTWPVPKELIGQVVAIHVSKYDDWSWEELNPYQLSSLDAPIPSEDPPCGCLIGTVKIMGQQGKNETGVWKVPGQFGHVYAEARQLVTPIPCRGERIYFDLPADVEYALSRQGVKVLTTVVNCRQKGVHYDVYIGRGSPFGNPFRIGPGSPRADVIAQFRKYFFNRLQTDADFSEQVKALRGTVLGCYCKPLACHGDVIAEWLDSGAAGLTAREIGGASD